jgi:hypothetical protein
MANNYFPELLVPGLYVDKHHGLCSVDYTSHKGYIDNIFNPIDLQKTLDNMYKRERTRNAPTDSEGEE